MFVDEVRAPHRSAVPYQRQLPYQRSVRSNYQVSCATVEQRKPVRRDFAPMHQCFCNTLSRKKLKIATPPCQQQLHYRPRPRKLILRPSLAFRVRGNYSSDTDPAEVTQFDFKAKNEDQKIVAAFTSGENLRWMASGFVHETGFSFRQLTELPVFDNVDTSPSWSPSPPSYCDGQCESDEEFYHLSRYVKAYDKRSCLDDRRILLDVNEILLDVDFWIRSYQGLDIAALADLILEYYSVFDAVAIRKQSYNFISRLAASQPLAAAWFTEDDIDYGEDCKHCQEFFGISTDCPRCWITW